ncbi:MAG: hypothetical protein IJS32_08610 [Kiritimatiellae bacterium]|nr:hypothetical protein [Kiritimatiellia bacterium]
MKKSPCLLAVLLAAAALLPASARATAIIGRGTSELGIDGSLAAHSADGTAFNLGLRYGYFVADRLSLGVLLDIGHSEHSDLDRVGAIAEYDWRMGDGYRAVIGSDFVPFVAAGLLGAWADVYDEDATGIVLRGETGLKFYLTDTAALVASVVAEWATDDMYVNKRKAVAWDLRATLGVRLLF